MNYRLKKWIIIAAVIIILLGAGAFVVRGKLFDKKNGSKSAEINTATVRRGDITISVSATGTIEPLVTVEVRSKASGAITNLAVDEGDTINAGDLIAEIEKTYTQADVDQAQADLISAQARLEQSKMNLDLQKQQSDAQIKQAQENVNSAQTRLNQLLEQIKTEKVTNARQLKDAQNDLAMAKLRQKQAKTPRSETVKRAETSVTQAKSSLDLAREEYNRRQALYEKSFVSKSEVESAKAQLDAAQAQYDSSLEQLKLTKQPSSEEELELADLTVAKSELAIETIKQKIKEEELRQKDVDLSNSQLEDAKTSLSLAIENKKQILIKEKDQVSAKASLVRSQVALKTAQDKLADTIVRAPISGTILAKSVEEGQVITSSMGAMASAGTLLVTMANLDNVYVKTDVDETDIGSVQPGQSVSITVDAYPDKTFQGVVLRVAPKGKVVQNVTLFQVISEIKNPSKILKPGMNASVEILTTDLKDVLVLDNEAIMDMQGSKMAIPVIDGKPSAPVSVVTGVRGLDTTEIIFGLEEGDVVALQTSMSGIGKMPQDMKNMMKNPMSTFRSMQGGGGGPGGPPPR